MARKKQWKEFYFDSDDDHHAMDSALRCCPEEGAEYHWEVADSLLVTNYPMSALRACARTVDVRLPEYITVPNGQGTPEGGWGDDSGKQP